MTLTDSGVLLITWRGNSLGYKRKSKNRGNSFYAPLERDTNLEWEKLETNARRVPKSVIAYRSALVKRCKDLKKKEY